MFNKFEYKQMLSQCNNNTLEQLSILLWHKGCIASHRKEKLICVQYEIQRRISEGSYE